MPVMLAGDTLLCQEPRNRTRRHPFLAQVEDPTDHSCLRFIDLPTSAVLFPDIAVPKRHAPAIDMAGLRPSDEPPLQALQNFRPLVFRECPSHLKEEPSLWSLFQRM